MDIKEVTQDEIIRLQKQATELLERYKQDPDPDKADTLELVKAFAKLVDLQNDFINQLIVRGQILSDYITNKPQRGNH